MSSKRLFSWQKRQSNADPYYKTGGLLSIDTLEGELSNDTEPKDTQKVRRRPSNLSIVPPDNQQSTSSPLSSSYNVRRISSTSNLMAIFNDMLRSPTSSTAACPDSASVHKPLPTRPRSSSVPSAPDLPVELPGSLLQQNQGYPYFETPDFVLSPSRPTSQNVRRGTHPPNESIGYEGDVIDLVHLFPEPLNHSRSVPGLNLEFRESAMKSSRSGTAPNTGIINKSKPHRVHHRRALSDIKWHTLADSNAPNYSNAAGPSGSVHGDSSNNSNRSRAESGRPSQAPPVTVEAAASNSDFERRASRRDDLGTCITPSPITTRSVHIEDLKATITTQGQTISKLQLQFGSLRSSHEAHVLSLADAHTAELASLRKYAKSLEEQSAQRPSLHHASSNNLPVFLDTTESSSAPSRESSQHTANISASSTLSIQSGTEKQQRPPTNSDMEILKRKLSSTRRPQTADRNLLPELNQFKQNNVALQTQIASLMAKLNESKKSEKALRATLQDVEQRCAEAESKASETQQLVSSAEALQNTIDHLESRLELANTEKLDAQEELFNMRALKSPFDAQFPELQIPLQDAHDSMDTVFSDDSQPGQQRSSTATMSTFVAHIEQLQDEIRHKDVYIVDLERDGMQLRHMLDQVYQQCDEINLQLDIQNELLGKTKEMDEHIEQLRTAIMEREAVIGEKEKSVRAVERQLEHHRLLLQAEIRKHAITSRYIADGSDPLPELTVLATKKDIDRWIQKLNQRLKKAKPMSPAKTPATPIEAHVEDLRNEIDFYVREIIYYKLDIRGYKSDIKKLKRIAAHLGSYGHRASDLDSDTSSLRPAPTPSHARFLSTTPELRSSEHSSPALASPVMANMGSTRTLTPPPSMSADSPSCSPSPPTKETYDDYEKAASRLSMTPHTPTKVTIISAPHTTPVAAVPTRQDTRRSVGESIVNMYTSPRTPGEPILSAHDDHSEMLAHAMGTSERSPLRVVDASNQATTSPNPLEMNETSFTLPIVSGDDRPSLERDVSNASTVRPVVPTSRFSRDLLPRSPSPKPHQTSHSRVGSGSSTISYTLQPQSTSRPERKSRSSTGIPFVIAMGSPHNPAIAVAAKNKPVTRPHKVSSGTSRAGVGGTMASSTPLSSPTSVESPLLVPARSPSATTGHKRKLSLSFRKQDNESPTTPTHSRNLSGGSIRTAIRWTKGANKEKEKEVQLRKDSIGMPQPLERLFLNETGMRTMGGETRAIDHGAVGEE